MRVLFLHKYGHKAASFRYRLEQFIPFLTSSGIEVEISSLFDDEYLAKKYETGRSDPALVLGAVARRISTVLAASKFDLVVLYYEAIPYFPGVLERYLSWRKIPYIYDFDDAIFHNYDLHRSKAIRRSLGGKISRIIGRATLVLAGNEYLARYAKKTNPNVRILPTVIDLDRYTPARRTVRKSPLNIGWIGSPSTAGYLQMLKEPLREVNARIPLKLTAIGSGPLVLPGVPTEVLPWREETEIDDIGRFDIGVMPLTDDPWSRGKCGFKLIQYMGRSLPVIASPVGANVSIVEDGVTGLLAADGGQWVTAIEKLATSPDLAARLGDAGRTRVAREFSVQERQRDFVSAIRRAVPS